MKRKNIRQKKFGKKAQVFPALFVLVTLIIFTTLYLDFAAKTKKFDNPDNKLGEREFAVLRTAAEGEKALLYIDLAADYAYAAAIVETAKQNYVASDSCGEYRGVPVVYGTTDCMSYADDLEKALEKTLTKHFNNAFVLYAEAYPDTSDSMTIPEKNYLLLFENGKVMGTAIAPLQFLILSTTSEEVIEQIGEEEKEEAVSAITGKYPKISAKNAQELVLKIDENYGEIIERAVAGTDVPKVRIIGLIAQESRGNPEAGSETGCQGLMQFCSGTAYDYGLCDTKGCSRRDERKIPEKAIPAGVRVLQDYTNDFSKYTYKIYFGLAAYNGGPGTIQGAIKATGKTNPSWEEVSAQIDESLIAKYFKGQYFDTTEEKRGKARQIIEYPGRVLAYSAAYEQATEKE